MSDDLEFLLRRSVELANEPTLFEQPNRARFDGDVYDPAVDDRRLTGQIQRIYRLMSDHQWRTTGEIAAATGDPQSSVLAQLGHLRKERFGAYLVEKRRRGDASRGLWEYRVGEKGEGTPRHHECARCAALEAEIEALREQVSA